MSKDNLKFFKKLIDEAALTSQQRDSFNEILKRHQQLERKVRLLTQYLEESLPVRDDTPEDVNDLDGALIVWPNGGSLYIDKVTGVGDSWGLWSGTWCANQAWFKDEIRRKGARWFARIPRIPRIHKTIKSVDTTDNGITKPCCGRCDGVSEICDGDSDG